MTKKFMYLIGGLVFLFLSLIGLTRDITAFKTQMAGDLITVKVTYVPKINFHNDVYYYFKFEYNDNGVLKEYSKKYFPRFCGDLVVGQELKLKADFKKNIFLCESEDVREQFYAKSALGLVGLIFLILWFKNKS